MRFFTWISSCILLLCTVLLLFFLSQPTRHSSRAYFKLKKEMEQEQNQSLSAEQKRTGVRKDYYLFDGKELLQTRLTAQSSSIFLKNEKEGIQIIEVMNQPNCVEQNFSNPSCLRYMEANKGIYYYGNETLTAHDLTFKHYQMDSERGGIDFFVDEPLAEGKASAATFSLQNGPNYSGKETKVHLPGEIEVKSPSSKWNPTHRSLNFDKVGSIRPYLKAPNGYLEADQIVISHNDLGWMVIAKGNIEGSSGGSATFKAQRIISVQIQKIEGRHQFSTLLAEGPVHVEMPSSGQYFDSKGLLTINHQKGEMIAQSALSPNGRIDLVDQVFFKDPLCGGYANTFQLNYDPTTLQVKNIILRGQVRLRNVFSAETAELYSLDQHALADEVQFDPVEKKMQLRGLNNSRVLFLDSINRMQMSAGALNITYDKEQKMPVVKGIGDVRLIFGEEELNKMKNWINSSN